MTQPEIHTAAEKLLALRHITRTTGTKTTRAQNEILQALPIEALTAVAVEVRRVETIEAVLSGRKVGSASATNDGK